MKKNTLPGWKTAKLRRPMQMGMGTLGSKVKCPECDEEFSHCRDIIFRRKFRWTIEGETPSGKFAEMFVKVNSRPTIEETEINFLSAKTWIPGKQHWNQMTITTYELDNKSEFWKSIASCVHEDGECPPEKYAKLKLNLYDGVGCLIESWDITDAYIFRANFVELDHTSSEIVDVELDIRYKNVVYKNGREFGEKMMPGYKPPAPSKATCPNCKHVFVVPHAGF